MSGSKPKTDEVGLLPGHWEDLFRKAGVQVEVLDAARSHRARATLLGNFLARNRDRVVPIEVDGRPGTARLCASDAGKRQRRYFFVVTFEDEEPSDSRPAPDLDDAPLGPDRDIPGRRPGRRMRRTKAAEKPAGLATVGTAAPPGRDGAGNEEDWS
jgi:hypothetical protein